MSRVDIDRRHSLLPLAFAILLAAALVLCAAPREGEAQSLPETAWSLEQARGIAPEQLGGPSLTRQGQLLSGSTGCNAFTATITAAGERVRIENVSLTRKLCAPHRNETERAFVAALGQTEYLEEQNGRLTFLSGTREPLLVWKSNADGNARMLRKAEAEKNPDGAETGQRPAARSAGQGRAAETAAKEAERRTAGAQQPLPYASQPVFFGTDRKREKDRRKDDRQLADFGSDVSGRLTLGEAVVTVPLNGREKGEIPRPGLLSKEDAAKHFTLFDVLVMSEREFIGAVRRRLDQAKEFKGQAFVFVHGYHISFEDALYRTAQISYDLGFDGVPFLYSWPSNVAILGYKRDLDHALGTRDHLREFVDLIAHQTSVKEINLIAHSMGSWPLLDVLSQIAKDAATQHGIHINQIILAAPDIDRNNFEALAKIIRPLARNLTVYASSKDWAMAASGILALGEDRVGYVPSRGIPIILPGVETIDVSKASLEFFRINHSEFAERWHILYDIGLILKNGTHPPDLRLPVAFEKVESPEGLFWRYREQSEALKP